MSYAKIIGVGKYLPDNIVTNDYLSTIVETSDEWITTRTGMKERRISNGEDTTDLAVNAAKNALEDAGISAEEIDLIIVATTTPDSLIPCIACRVQNEIGAVNAAAFDLTAACSGLIYGLNIGKNFIFSGQLKKVLVIGSEVLSKIIDWTDRNTCVLFGDGASALVLAESKDIEGLKSVHIGSDGSKGKYLTCSAIKLENIFVNDKEGYDNKVRMNGKEIFKFAVNVISDSIKQILEENKLSMDDIKYVVCHQANSRIIEFAAKRLNADINKFYMNMEKYGNTSSASIGIALDDIVKAGMLKKGDKVIIAGFGGGLTWGSALIEWAID